MKDKEKKSMKVAFETYTPGEPKLLFRALLIDDQPRIEVSGIPGPEVDPGAIGIVLADAIKTYASMYKDVFEVDEKAALERIRETLNAELDHPTAPVAFSTEDKRH